MTVYDDLVRIRCADCGQWFFATPQVAWVTTHRRVGLPCPPSILRPLDPRVRT